MPKNIVICLDGTGNQLKAKGCTNVLKTFELLDLTDPAKQIAYYDPGVGTFSAQGAWTPLGKRLTRLLGLAFGFGLRAKLARPTSTSCGTRRGRQNLPLRLQPRAYTARASARHGEFGRTGVCRWRRKRATPRPVDIAGRSRPYGLHGCAVHRGLRHIRTCRCGRPLRLACAVGGSRR